MAKPLSPDLRIRIIRAVEDQGMSCRGAASRFGVAPSTAIELVSDFAGSNDQLGLSNLSFEMLDFRFGLGKDVTASSVTCLQLFEYGAVLRDLLSVPRDFAIVTHVMRLCTFLPLASSSFDQV
jgi:hypothetical protein